MVAVVGEIVQWVTLQDIPLRLRWPYSNNLQTLNLGYLLLDTLLEFFYYMDRFL